MLVVGISGACVRVPTTRGSSARPRAGSRPRPSSESREGSTAYRLQPGPGPTFLCLAEPFGGAVGGALELLEPSRAHRAAAVEPRSIQVEALAVVVRLRAQLVQPGGLAVGHGRPRRRARSASAARFTGGSRRAFEDPSLSRRATCLSLVARSWSLRLIRASLPPAP
jgi:hypothetical protein